MAEIVEAVYERGLLRPRAPLNLRERQTVRIQVLSGPAQGEERIVMQVLEATGLLHPDTSPRRPPPPSAEERQALAEQWASVPGKLLSEIVTIEERGEP